ncbi:MAG TPA: hypothetical protein DG753_00390 [Clostridium sp.]|nr:hypothetical protein [Clostridium sp.]
MNDKTVHLALNYKMDVKKLEDHYRIATKASEVEDNYSILLYINLEDGEDFVNALTEMRSYQKQIFNQSNSSNNK